MNKDELFEGTIRSAVGQGRKRSWVRRQTTGRRRPKDITTMPPEKLGRRLEAPKTRSTVAVDA